jgi:hypothetical protein
MTRTFAIAATSALILVSGSLGASVLPQTVSNQLAATSAQPAEAETGSFETDPLSFRERLAKDIEKVLFPQNKQDAPKRR